MIKTLLRSFAISALVLPAAATAQDPAAMVLGAQVYQAYCASCHNARASSERTDLEWVAITLHMRARANFTKSEAAGVLAFLQATNLPETATTMSQGAEAPDSEAGMIVVPEQLRAALAERARESAGESKPARGNQ